MAHLSFLGFQMTRWSFSSLILALTQKCPTYTPRGAEEAKKNHGWSCPTEPASCFPQVRRERLLPTDHTWHGTRWGTLWHCHLQGGDCWYYLLQRLAFPWAARVCPVHSLHGQGLALLLFHQRRSSGCEVTCPRSHAQCLQR